MSAWDAARNIRLDAPISKFECLPETRESAIDKSHREVDNGGRDDGVVQLRQCAADRGQSAAAVQPRRPILGAGMTGRQR